MSEILTKLRQNSTNKFIPLQASLELTNRCNERCTHCYLESFEDDEKRLLQLADWYHILDELRSAGTLYLILMGGEAMLSPHFWSVAQRAASLGFHVSTITNGLKIKDIDTAKQMKEVGLNHVTISLYCLNPEIHDSMTKVKGSCERTKKAVDYCLEAGLEVGINCLITEANIRNIFDVYDWCIERDIEIKVDPNVTAGLLGNLNPTKYRASEESLKWYYREMKNRWPNSRPQASGETAKHFVCNAGKGKCAVTAYGELLPCIEIRESLGQLNKTPFQELWFSKNVEKWRQMKVGDLTNRESESYQYCDHCPGMAKNEKGNPYKILDYSQQVASIKQQVALEK